MLDLSSGKITIDGVDLSCCSRDIVRSAFVSVPQDAAIIEGNVRFNLDPRGLRSTEEMESALRKVQLWDIVDRAGGLDALVDDLHLSHGQRQLFSLVRAMLSEAKILLLDEATSRQVLRFPPPNSISSPSK
jgi:ATP-binding cassette, subfamily C (CFTR/MRP), member 1